MSRKILFAAYTFQENAQYWWRTQLEIKILRTREEFLVVFKKEYNLAFTRIDKIREFLHLQQGDMTVREYLAKFTRLFWYTTSMIQDDKQKTRLFEDVLHDEIRKIINVVQYKT